MDEAIPKRKGQFLVVKVVTDSGIMAAALNVNRINAIESTDDKRGSVVHYNRRKLTVPHKFDLLLNYV